MSKHRQGYFKGNYKSYLLTAYTSYRKSTERVTNKQIAEELGISVRTLYNYKNGKGLRSEKSEAVKKEITNYTTKAGALTSRGKILYQAVETLRKKYPNVKNLKELTPKQLKKLKEKVNEVEIEAEEIFEAHYSGEGL